MKKVTLKAILNNEDVLEEVSCTAYELFDLIYRKDWKKIVRYFYNNRKKVPSFNFGWLDARARKPKDKEPIIDDLFGAGPLSNKREVERHRGPMTAETRAAAFHYGRQTQLYNDCFTHAHNYNLGFYDIVDRSIMRNLLAWKKHESPEYITERKKIAGIRVDGVAGIYMTPTEAYSYKDLFYWDPEFLG